MTTKIKYGLKMRLDKNLVISKVPLFSNNMTYTFSNYFYQSKNNDCRIKILYTYLNFSGCTKSFCSRKESKLPPQKNHFQPRQINLSLGKHPFLILHELLQWFAIKNHQDLVNVVYWHFSRRPDRF